MAGVVVTIESQGVIEAIAALDVIVGEVENVQAAALFDLAERAARHLRDEPRNENGWPRDPDNPTDHPRSADLWQAGQLSGGAVLYNSAPYASFVHIQGGEYGGPPALAFRTNEGPIRVIEDYSTIYAAEMSVWIARLVK